MIREIWNSDVNRWHASRCHALRNSGDTTDAHAARCCRLLLALNPDASANLIAATLHHDVAERVTGDVPWGAKQDATLRDTLVRLEIAETMRLGLTEPRTAEEADWIKLVDRLDAYMWCQMVDRAELARQDWRNSWADILARADALGVRGPVHGLIGECGGCPPRYHRPPPFLHFRGWGGRQAQQRPTAGRNEGEMMRVEAGKHYKTRDGKKVGPMRTIVDAALNPARFHKFTDGRFSWGEFGQALSTGWEFESDLIAEWGDDN